MNETAMMHTSLFTIPQPFVDLVVQLISTLIGVVVGFLVVLFYDRKKREEENNQTINRMLDAIIEELSSFQEMVVISRQPAIQIVWNSASKDFVGSHISVSTPAFQSAVSSGNFSLLKAKLQTELGKVYLTVDDCKVYNDQIINYYGTAIYASMGTFVDREAMRLCNTFNSKIQQLRNELSDILPKLIEAKIPIKKHYRFRATGYVD